MSANEAHESDLSGLAHELKTPLAVIAGFAELLQARDDDETRRQAATHIAEASERLSKAIDRLLAAAGSDGDLARQLLEALSGPDPA